MLPVKYFIKTNRNICIKCSHFSKPFNRLASEALDGKCKLFGTQNVVTGELEYDYAFECRRNILKCGMEAKFYRSIDMLPPS